MEGPELATGRMVLRRWKDTDRAPFAAMQADVEGMHFVAKLPTTEDSEREIDENEAAFERDGFGLWVLERRTDGRFLGYTGLAHSDFDAPFCPAIDAGWHLTRDVWGQGYATEAARAVFDFAFDEIGLHEIVAHTSARNTRSIAVMRRLGMTHSALDDFDAPWFEPDHPFRPYVLYRTNRSQWARTLASATRC